MAHSLSAKKRDRQNAKRRGKNHWRKDQVKEAIKTFEKLVHDGDKTKAADQLKLVYKTLDRTSCKGTIHRNTAARKKAQLARKLNKIGEKAHAAKK